MKIAEHRRDVLGLPDLLLYASLVSDGVLMLQNGGLIWPRRRTGRWQP